MDAGEVGENMRYIPVNVQLVGEVNIEIDENHKDGDICYCRACEIVFVDFKIQGRSVEYCPLCGKPIEKATLSKA